MRCPASAVRLPALPAALSGGQRDHGSAGAALTALRDPAPSSGADRHVRPMESADEAAILAPTHEKTSGRRVPSVQVISSAFFYAGDQAAFVLSNRISSLKAAFVPPDGFRPIR